MFIVCRILKYYDTVIHTSDILCLDDEQFLNDAIISFWLRFITQTMLDEEQRKRIHIFNSYFYEALTDKKKAGEGATPTEKRHSRVKKWTKNVNLFEKDFIIIPVNEV